jgi:hypothetical protein
MKSGERLERTLEMMPSSSKVLVTSSSHNWSLILFTSERKARMPLLAIGLMSKKHCLSGALVIMEQKLEPHLAGRADSKKRQKVLTIHGLYKYIYGLLITL